MTAELPARQLDSNSAGEAYRFNPRPRRGYYNPIVSQQRAALAYLPILQTGCCSLLEFQSPAGAVLALPLPLPILPQ